MEIALIGNPNCGKTSLFNQMTGNRQRVGNWPGVTVEKKEGNYKLDRSLTIQDLPGIYSMSPYSPEELLARDYLLNHQADVIINVIDSTNLERNLYLTTQLLEAGLPLVIALNMSDILKNQGKFIDEEKLSYQLGVPVISTSATKKTGLDKVIKTAKKIAKSDTPKTYPNYGKKFEVAIAEIIDVLGDTISSNQARFYAIKLFEGDQQTWERLALSDFQTKEIKDVIKITEEIYTEDALSILINERYTFIEKVAKMVQTKQDDFTLTLSDRVDQVVTNRFLALPIFALIMWLVYYLSIQTVGTFGTDWVNDVLFGQYLPDLISSWLDYLNVDNWMQSLILDGILAGCGAVIGFVPQIFVLFLCLGILEDIGYMSRVAFVMDRFFRRFGMSGKSFIPMLIATGCGVPGVMASRTIENERDRRITIMTTTFMPCSAKLPIIALVAGAFFQKNPWVAPSAYFVGVAAIVLSGIALKKTKTLGGLASPFIMELPSYHLPKASSVVRYASNKAMSFIQRAGSVIFVMNILILFLSSYNLSLEAVDTEDSMLATLGRGFAVFFTPLGFGNWRAAIATITGLIAKETVVSTFGVLYNVKEATEGSQGLWMNLQIDYTALSAYSFLIFNLLCAPCFAAVGAIKREMSSLKWTIIAIAFQTGLAYSVSLIIYQIGLLFAGKDWTFWTIVALLLIVCYTYLIFRQPKQEKLNTIKLENLLSKQK